MHTKIQRASKQETLSGVARVSVLAGDHWQVVMPWPGSTSSACNDLINKTVESRLCAAGVHPPS